MQVREWRILMLGGLRARRSDRTIARFKTGKTGECLAYLAYYPRYAHRREELSSRLWPDADPGDARSSLRSALASLRRQLEPVPGAEPLLLVSSADVALNQSAAETDTEAFEAALRRAADADSGREDRITFLTEAVDLYQGELLAGYSAEWIELERQRLNTLHIHARLQLVLALESAGRPEAALLHAQRLVQEDPLSDEAQHALMRLYESCGQVSSALRQFRTFQRILRRELGESPSAAITQLARRLRKNEGEPSPVLGPVSEAEQPTAAAATLEVEPAAPSPSTARPTEFRSQMHRFPVPMSPIFGREQEIARIIGLFRGAARASAPAARIVTLTGAGGIGKTRLALELANRYADQFHAVFFVTLSGAATFDQMLQAMLHAVCDRTAPQGALRDQITEALKQYQTVLLILDNCEQLIASENPGTEPPTGPEASSAIFIAELVTQVAGLQCLVTSRQALRVSDERVVPVKPLDVPSMGWEADRIRESASVKLFVERSRLRNVDFAVTPRNAATLASICAAVEGLPLAIELAASWAYRIPLTEILQNLDAPLDFLKEASPGRADRHATLRKTIAWSYNLLPGGQKEIFAGLSVFRGWTLPAAAAVLEIADSALLPIVRALCDHSLAEYDEFTDSYRMREAIREYASEQQLPANSMRFRQRHASHYLVLAQSAIQSALGPEEALWLDRLETEIDNIRAALSWSLGSETALRLTAALHQFWYIRGYLSEGVQWMRQALESYPDAPDSLRSSTLNALGVYSWTLGDHAQAHLYLSEALRLREATGDLLAIAGLRNNLGTLALCLGNLPLAREHLEVSIALHRQQGKNDLLSHALFNLAGVVIDMGHYDEAGTLLDESLKLAEDNQDQLAVANGRHLSGVIALTRGDLIEGERHLAVSLRIRHSLKDRRNLPGVLVWTGVAALRRGDPMRAARLFCAGSALSESISVTLSSSDAMMLAEGIAGVKEEVGDQSFETACEEGRSLALDQLLDYALDGLGKDNALKNFVVKL